QPNPPPFPYTTLFRSGAETSRVVWTGSGHPEVILARISKSVPSAGACRESLPPLTIPAPLRNPRELSSCFSERYIVASSLLVLKDRKSTRLNSSHVSI